MIEESSINRPGRPKDSAKREDIVVAATQLFMEKGYELTSMEAVAREACVSKLTIYSHFADKLELFRAIIQHRCTKIGMPDSYAVEATMTAEQALLKIGRHVMSIVISSDSLRLMRVIQAEALHHPEVVHTYYDAGPRRAKTAFIALLEAFNRQGQLLIPDTTRASEQFFSLLKGEVLQRILLMISPVPDPEQLENHIKATVAFFLAAYRPLASAQKAETEHL